MKLKNLKERNLCKLIQDSVNKRESRKKEEGKEKERERGKENNKRENFRTQENYEGVCKSFFLGAQPSFHHITHI